MSEVRDNPEKQRFELAEQGHLAIAEYRVDGGVMAFTHTLVPPSLQGMGIGSRLIEAALGEARDRGLKVDPQCQFVAAHIAKHPEWRDLRV